MSSIFGKINSDDKPVAEDIALMLSVLNHWEADETGTWVDGNAGIGHLMLYNTPESKDEKLPFYDGEANLSITADARIDNRDELYPKLGIAGAMANLLPDSTLILLAYKKYGKDCVKHLLGDFGFAIWDCREKTLFCARDQMGVKPFYYYNDIHFFAFASEKKGLLCLPGLNREMNKQYYYSHLFNPPLQAADTTIYQHIRRLPPAHFLIFDYRTGKMEQTHYWTLDPYTEIKFAKKEEYYDGLKFHFEEAVKCRIRSLYPIGVELSGGMDSSSITGVASHFLKQRGEQIIPFSSTYSDSFFESQGKTKEEMETYIMDVIRFNEIKKYFFVNREMHNDQMEEIDFLLKLNDGLEEYTQGYLIIIKNEAKRHNVRTMFSGFPGDEMVTYLGVYYFLDYLDQKQYKKYFLAKSDYPFNKLKPFFSPHLSFLAHKALNIIRCNSFEFRRLSAFFDVPFIYRYRKGDIAWKDINFTERYMSYRHYQRYRLLKTRIPLRMEDETRTGLHFKIEPRFPMADIRLTQFYLSMPNSIKYEGEMKRTAWRKAMGQYLPESILKTNNKYGVLAPFRWDKKKDDLLLRKFLEIMGRNENYPEYRNIDNLKKYKKHPLTKYISVLRWAENNFDNGKE